MNKKSIELRKQELSDIPIRRLKPEDVTEYGKLIGFDINGEHFIDYYEQFGWMIGRRRIKSWTACVRTWKHRCETSNAIKKSTSTISANEIDNMLG